MKTLFDFYMNALIRAAGAPAYRFIENISHKNEAEKFKEIVDFLAKVRAEDYERYVALVSQFNVGRLLDDEHKKLKGRVS